MQTPFNDIKVSKFWNDIENDKEIYLAPSTCSVQETQHVPQLMLVYPK